MNLLTLEAALALRDVFGYPQNELWGARMLYEAYLPFVGGSLDDPSTWTWHLRHAIPPHRRELDIGRTTGHWVNAPDPLTALQHVTTQLDCIIINVHLYEGQSEFVIDLACDAPFPHCSDPSAVILALAAHNRQHSEEAR